MLREKIIIITIISFATYGFSNAQKKIIKSENYKIRLHYKKNQVVDFICLDMSKPYFQRQRDKEMFNLSWAKGELHISSMNKGCGGRVEYIYRFDSLFRVFESYVWSEWSNHRYKEYLVRKFKQNDIKPYNCMSCTLLNYPFEKNVSHGCDFKFRWLDIVEDELNSRNKYYVKGSDPRDYDYFFEFFSSDDFVRFWPN